LIKLNPPCSWCISCEKKRVLKWRAKNKDKATQYRHTSYQRVCKEVFEAYGNKCQCCGESRPEFLVIDHKYNDGAKHRRQLKARNFYHWLRQNNYPKDRFQILCWNCNMAKSIYGKCPHKRKKKC
jgi:hypothetical protein